MLVLWYTVVVIGDEFEQAGKFAGSERGNRVYKSQGCTTTFYSQVGIFTQGYAIKIRQLSIELGFVSSARMRYLTSYPPDPWCFFRFWEPQFQPRISLNAQQILKGLTSSLPSLVMYIR